MAVNTPTEKDYAERNKLRHAEAISWATEKKKQG